MKIKALLIAGSLLACLLPCGAVQRGTVEDRVPGIEVEVKRNTGTVYQLLRHVSDQTGYLFLYDSHLIDNDKKVRIEKKRYTLRDIIYAITGNPDLEIVINGNHILLKAGEPAPPGNPSVKHGEEAAETTVLFFSGRVFDSVSGESIPYVSVGVENSTIGTSTNMDGEFRLVYPDSLATGYVRIIHLGYETRRLPLEHLTWGELEIPLEPQIVTLQEVVVNTVDPVSAIKKMLDSCHDNYADKDVLLLPFYREKMEYGRKSTELTEGVFHIYKTPWSSVAPERVKLLKMRRVASDGYEDILPKLKSGIETCLILDLVKYPPDFLIFPEAERYYKYFHSDITVMDGRRVNVISFYPICKHSSPLFIGELYIDVENYALIGASFGIDDNHIAEASNDFIVKKDRNVRLSLTRAWYNVTYNRGDDGKYYPGHMKSDISFRYKKKKGLFASNLNVTVEMVVCDIEKENVGRLRRQETIVPGIVFSDVKHPYDRSFWEEFNVILPEKDLKKLIMNNLNEIVEDREGL